MGITIDVLLHIKYLVKHLYQGNIEIHPLNNPIINVLGEMKTRTASRLVCITGMLWWHVPPV